MVWLPFGYMICFGSMICWKGWMRLEGNDFLLNVSWRSRI